MNNYSYRPGGPRSSGIAFFVLFGLLAVAMPLAPIGAIEPFDAPVTAEGDVLVLTGRILGLDGRPVGGAAVEIWQTDNRGNYDHPGDSGTGNRDRGFQFFGTSVSDESGRYAFRTILPGRYEPRPRHIHVKIRLDNRSLLTSQLYFAMPDGRDDAGRAPTMLTVPLESADDSSGPEAYAGRFDFIVDTGMGGGSQRPTMSQGEGPYYPLKDVSLMDNDLAAVP